MKKFLISLIAAVGLSTPVQAETLEYQAISDFSDTNAGEVPYYIHNGASALAINAGNAAYRNKYARATTDFDGSAGNYDVTIAALGELDGECEFRFLVNGVVVGTAVNARVNEDYGVQNHTFENISIPADAEIAVESNSVSNGLVPENGIFAFARGRWVRLTLESVDAVSATPIDLELSVDIDNENPEAGETLSLEFEITNNNSTQTATNPVLTFTAPAQLSVDANSQCRSVNNQYTCELAELNADQTLRVTLTGVADATGTGQLAASIIADQSDNTPSNNSATQEIKVTGPLTSNTNVDLAVTITSDVSTVNVGDTISYTLTIVNQHQSNVATSPVAGILLPGGLNFNASSECTTNNRSVVCELPELAAGESTTVNFTANSSAPGNTIVIASVSAAEAETNAGDNEALYSITSTDLNRNAPTDPDLQSISNGGTGFTGPLTLIGLYFMVLFRRRV